MQFQPILSKIVNASVSKLYELSVQMSSFEWCCNSILCNPRLRLELKTSLASFCPHFALKSQYEHPNIIAQIIFSISILTCIHIYGASIWRGKNEANILLFSRNFYSSETHTYKWIIFNTPDGLEE